MTTSSLYVGKKISCQENNIFSEVKNIWARVTKLTPCPICKHPDWCTYSLNAFCCMRVQSSTQMKNGGWLHKLDGDIPRYLPPIKPAQEVKIDAQAIWGKWFQDTDKQRLKAFASILGVEPMALLVLGCARSQEHAAWAFPMKDGLGKVIGIRLRNSEGQKWAVKGSKQGLFIPDIDLQPTMVITEGPTDCAAALTLGFSAIGRPSCLGCEEIIAKLIAVRKIRRVVIVSDNDTPGQNGAAKLQSTLKVPSVIFIPPTKDLREFVRAGGDTETFNSLLKNLCWETPK